MIGNPLFTCLQIAIGHPTRHSTANPKKTQAKISPKRFKPGFLSVGKNPATLNGAAGRVRH